MQAHEYRVVLEMEDLSDKLTRLDAFLIGPIFASLPEAERLRLKRQSLIMHLYVDVLQERIANFA